MSIATSIILLLIGSYGFLRKKWNIWKAYVFFWLAPSLFGFGILPTQFPDWTLSRQIIYSVSLSIASFVLVGYMLWQILIRKGK